MVNSKKLFSALAIGSITMFALVGCGVKPSECGSDICPDNDAGANDANNDGGACTELLEGTCNSPGNGGATCNGTKPFCCTASADGKTAMWVPGTCGGTTDAGTDSGACREEGPCSVLNATGCNGTYVCCGGSDGSKAWVPGACAATDSGTADTGTSTDTGTADTGSPACAPSSSTCAVSGATLCGGAYTCCSGTWTAGACPVSPPPSTHPAANMVITVHLASPALHSWLSYAEVAAGDYSPDGSVVWTGGLWREPDGALKCYTWGGTDFTCVLPKPAGSDLRFQVSVDRSGFPTNYLCAKPESGRLDPGSTVTATVDGVTETIHYATNASGDPRYVNCQAGN